ncbi:hypothetical protein AVEN_76858-1, partial [Araneus ventricosus]
MSRYRTRYSATISAISPNSLLEVPREVVERGEFVTCLKAELRNELRS